jgi:glycine/D-amino acid oxidase-like deaminating enzyme
VDAAFQPEGSFLAALSGSGQAEELEESGELLRGRGFEVEWWDRRRVAAAAGSERLDGALFQPRDGGLDPVRLCRGLARLGTFEVRTGVAVRAIAGDRGRVTLSTTAGLLVAHRVVLAMNAYLPFLVPSLSAVVRPVRGQVLATAPGPRHLAGVWYVNDGYEYLRQLPDGTLILGGRRRAAERVEVGYAETPTGTVQGALEEFLQATFPALAGRPIVDRWAGIMGFTADGFPRLGELPHLGPVVYGAGFSGHGLSLGFVTGRYLARRVLEREPGELF